MASRWRLRLCGVAAAVLLVVLPGRGDADEPTRVVAVRVAADEHYRVLPNWEAALRGHFANVSDSYERQFQIRLHVAQIVSWTTGSEPASAFELLERLKRDVPARGVDLVIGLAGRRCEGFPASLSIPFGHAAVKCGAAAVPGWVLESGLSYEIANIFGGHHAEPSWNRWLVRGTNAGVFADPTARVIRLMRGHDFTRGAAGMDESTRQRLLAVYRERGSTDGWNPLAYALSSHAWALHHAGDRKAAVGQLREVIAIEPAAAQPHADIGNIHLAAGKLHEAVAEFHRALAKDSRNAEALTGLGLVHVQRKDLDAAVRELRKAIAVNEWNPPARRALGAILLDRKEYQAAADMLAGFVEGDTKARLHLALAYRGAGRRREAWAQVEWLRARDVEAIPQELIEYITRHRHP